MWIWIEQIIGNHNIDNFELKESKPNIHTNHKHNHVNLNWANYRKSQYKQQKSQKPRFIPIINPIMWVRIKQIKGKHNPPISPNRHKLPMNEPFLFPTIHKHLNKHLRHPLRRLHLRNPPHNPSMPILPHHPLHLLTLPFHHHHTIHLLTTQHTRQSLVNALIIIAKIDGPDQGPNWTRIHKLYR